MRQNDKMVITPFGMKSNSSKIADCGNGPLILPKHLTNDAYLDLTTTASWRKHQPSTVYLLPFGKENQRWDVSNSPSSDEEGSWEVFAAAEVTDMDSKVVLNEDDDPLNEDQDSDDPIIIVVDIGEYSDDVVHEEKELRRQESFCSALNLVRRGKFDGESVRNDPADITDHGYISPEDEFLRIPDPEGLSSPSWSQQFTFVQGNKSPPPSNSGRGRKRKSCESLDLEKVEKKPRRFTRFAGRYEQDEQSTSSSREWNNQTAQSTRIRRRRKRIKRTVIKQEKVDWEDPNPFILSEDEKLNNPDEPGSSKDNNQGCVFLIPESGSSTSELDPTEGTSNGATNPGAGRGKKRKGKPRLGNEVGQRKKKACEPEKPSIQDSLNRSEISGGSEGTPAETVHVCILVESDPDKSHHRTGSHRIRDSHQSGTITALDGGYHVVWKSSLKGKDSLHDSQGYRYGYVVNRLGSFTTPTDREAFWRCTGNFRLPNGSLKRCWMVLHEKDGVITAVRGRQHMEEPHLPVERKWKTCLYCRPLLSGQE